jgi:hypothetical protein
MFRKICLFLTLLFAFSGLTFLPAQTARHNDDAEVQAMKSDVQRMRVMLNQLRTNLAFVDTTQSPLKHQFELEADMWQMTLDQMDRRIAAMENSRQQTEPRK